ncbi:MAG: electron transfer flavoprotein subunit beta/FixA family protein [Candidatus Marinimicrobia bacterium]|nr:electron transfer flavoprotein subunit beta/FixA family protein [Candidatus Neomarinimicrobiota bacterium]
MKICVLIKQVPDKDSSLNISDDHLTLVENNITWVSNESDNYALEEALLLKEKHGGEVIACTLGKDSARQVLKDALAKGADRGIFISDSSFDNLDVLSLGKIIASSLEKENFDIIMSGLQSDDQGNSQLGLILAELLNMSHATLGMGTEVVDDSTIKVKKELEGGWFQWTKLSLPASISIQSGINSPRYATLKGIMMVKKKTVDEVTSGDVAADALESNVTINKIYVPDKTKETQFIEGSPDEISEKLVELFRNDIKVLN